MVALHARYGHISPDKLSLDEKGLLDIDPPVEIREGVETVINIEVNDEFDSPVYHIAIKPGKAIVADIYYQGSIECRDFESDLDEKRSYNPSNLLFNAHNLIRAEGDHYRWRTHQFPGPNTKLPSRYKKSNIPTSLAQTIAQRKIPLQMWQGLKQCNTLEERLALIHSILGPRVTGEENLQNQERYNYNIICDEFEKTGKIKGNCKATSTFTAGLINALGLPSRVVMGNVFREEDIDESGNPANHSLLTTGHLWTEAYVPLSKKAGLWIPVDAAGAEAFLHYPSTTDIYAINADLPLFKNPNIKTARLKIQYE